MRHSVASRPNTYDLYNSVIDRPPNGKHDDRTKYAALAIYAETGSATTVAETLKLPRTSVRYWLDQPENDEVIADLRQIMRQKLAHTYMLNAQLAANEITDRLLNGDEVIDSKGNVYRKKVPAKELAYVMSVSADKHALITGSMQERKADASLAKLADQLTSLLATASISKLPKSEQHVDKSANINTNVDESA